MVTATPTSDLSSFLSSSPNVERLYDNVQSQVPAVTLAAVKMASWNTVEDFFIRSTCRREKIYWQMPSGVYQVDFNPFDPNWLVAWILEYTGLSQGKIEPPGLLKDVTWPQPQTLREGRALLALKPTSFSADFGSLVWEQWFETILDGTLYRLYRQPAKPFSSPELAKFHGLSFRAGVARARAIAQASYTDGGGRWCFPYFAAGRPKQ